MKTILYLLSFAIFSGIYSCSSRSNNSPSSFGIGQEEIPKTAEELRIELQDQEKNEPLTYISTENAHMEKKRIQTRKAGIFRDAEYAPDGALVTGYCRNAASIARFKDVVLKIKFFSATNSLIEEQQYIIYKYFPPNSVTDFTIRTETYPEAMQTFSVEVVNATATQ